MALPRNLQYNSKVQSAMAKSYKANIAPQNGTGNYSLGDVPTFNIPTRRNTFLCSTESFLKWTFQVTNGSGATNYYRWDSAGGASVIDRIRVYHGSNLLEDTGSYGMLNKMLKDLQVNTPSTFGKFNIVEGTRADQIMAPSAAIAAADATHVNGVAMTAGAATSAELTSILNSVMTQSVNVINSGDYLGSVANAASSTAQTYCHCPISMLGSLSSQYVPLFAMTSAPLRMEVVLCDAINKFLTCVSGTGSTITISNFEYVAQMIELSDEAMNIVIGSLGGQPLQYCLPQWRNYIATPTLANNSVIQIPIAHRCSSLRSIFITTRDQQGSTNLYPPHSSVVDGLSSYQFRIGPNLWPAKAPASSAEFFMECLKAIGSISDLGHSPSIDKNSYTLNASVLEAAIANNTLYAHSIQRGTNQSGSFYIGLDLENYPNSNKDQTFAGYNSQNDDIYAMLTYGTVGVAGATRYDAFCLMDVVLVCENQCAYLRY